MMIFNNLKKTDFYKFYQNQLHQTSHSEKKHFPHNTVFWKSKCTYTFEPSPPIIGARKFFQLNHLQGNGPSSNILNCLCPIDL